MLKRKLRLPSPALVISMVTLSLVLGGTAVAATAAGGDAKADTKLVRRLAPSLTVRHARTADSAIVATRANNANNATDATRLGGRPATSYLPNSAVKHGTFILSANTTKVLFTDGPLSLTGTCTLSMGKLSISVNDVSTVGNWIYGSTLEAAPGTVLNNEEDDFGTGTFNGGNSEFNFMAPDGNALRGQYAFGVNWPSAGQCYVSVVGIPDSS